VRHHGCVSWDFFGVNRAHTLNLGEGGLQPSSVFTSIECVCTQGPFQLFLLFGSPSWVTAVDDAFFVLRGLSFAFLECSDFTTLLSAHPCSCKGMESVATTSNCGL
jgi:hypothetical protein